ncbi:S-layer domain protein [Paenibacillus vortex V453]|uniref:S-layer domain protein n=1 Tax=Paenibacillus vortex V453 TaxID=715225 RepID=A0A2R9SYI7_9BACL|nr:MULTISPECIES: S-layer homology domain-containing protein [Paenibacillus]AWP29192.1 S-layer protein [Paenibacillus sp. Cedars]EFU42445.1 S-layer domain protein [Paenibacillus vortex V453]
MKKISISVLTAISVLLASLALNPVEAAQADASVEEKAETRETVNKNFRDIQGHWAQAAINDAIQRGYVDGYPDGRFLPNHQVSRAEFIKMAVSAMDIELGSSSSGSWYTPYVKAAESAGIYKAGDFANNQLTQRMTREEMSKLAVKALGYKDVEDKQWMYLASKDGIISGTAPGVISPQGTTTRAQAIAVIERLLQVKNGKELPVDKYAVAAAEVYWHKTNIFSVAPEIFNGPDNNNKNVGIDSWKMSKLQFGATDGSVVAQVDELIAIDWNDPKDPNRKLLPSKEKLVWIQGSNRNVFTNDLQAYVILLKSHYVVNEKPKLYPAKELALNIRGFNGKANGTVLNMPRIIESTDPKKQFNGLVIPKQGFSTGGIIEVMVETISAGAPVYLNKLSRSILIK